MIMFVSKENKHDREMNKMDNWNAPKKNRGAEKQPTMVLMPQSDYLVPFIGL